jgi:hypothetical protein
MNTDPIFNAAIKKLKTDGYKLSSTRDFTFHLENPELAQGIDLGDILISRTYRCRFRPTKQDVIVNALSDEVGREMADEFTTSCMISGNKLGKSICLGFTVTRAYEKTLLFVGNLDVVYLKKPFIEYTKEMIDDSKDYLGNTINRSVDPIILLPDGPETISKAYTSEVFDFRICYRTNMRKSTSRWNKDPRPVKLQRQHHFRMNTMNNSIIRVVDLQESMVNKIWLTTVHCRINYKHCIPVVAHRKRQLRR